MKEFINKNEKYHCFSCGIPRHIRELRRIPPENTEVKTDEYQIYLVCGHQISVKVSNRFEPDDNDNKESNL